MSAESNNVSRIEFELLENGLDFINNSVQSILESKYAEDLKYSILHISSGIELVLKEILRQEHWSLIFENVDRAEYSKLLTGDFQSVSFGRTLDRLKRIAEVEIAENEIKSISIIKRKRNRIEHFAFKDNDMAIKSNVSKALASIIGIINRNISLTDYSIQTQSLYKEILVKSSQFNEFKHLINAKIAEELEYYEMTDIHIITCPDCFQDSFPLNGSLRCLFCGYSDSAHEVASLYVNNVVAYDPYTSYHFGEEEKISECPKCYFKALVLSDDNIFCTSCGSNWDNNLNPT